MIIPHHLWDTHKKYNRAREADTVKQKSDDCI